MTPPNIAIYDWIHRAFDFRGRSSRSDYWWPFLLMLTVQMVLIFLFLSAIGPEASQQLLEQLQARPNDLTALDVGPLPSLAKFALTAGGVVALLTFVPNLSVAWRRYHDLGRPGWLHLIFMVMGLVLPAASLAELVWFAFPGTRGPNRYGPAGRDRYV